jgi:hypothetical protein
MNLLLYDPHLAEEVRVNWQQRSGQTYQPWADVMCIIGILDNLRDHAPGSAARHAIDTALMQSVSALGR